MRPAHFRHRVHAHQRNCTVALLIVTGSVLRRIPLDVCIATMKHSLKLTVVFLSTFRENDLDQNLSLHCFVLTRTGHCADPDPAPPAVFNALPACFRVAWDRNQLVNRSTFLTSAADSVLYFKQATSFVTFNTRAPSHFRSFVTNRVCTSQGQTTGRTSQETRTQISPSTQHKTRRFLQ